MKYLEARDPVDRIAMRALADRVAVLTEQALLTEGGLPDA